ncbi:LysE family translocator [Alkalimarinus sediminis]|uniref:LysE family translocator n=1 Tax=Alkalimarinus sediminis TaxID=1632866 RepID=A0A9E8HJ03_9ALTE|nr:LysE family translocator [Alkalimarinus sediminis]UZW73593.1 LysE family translocator [Alkalimarinus sediminis]
MSTESAFTFFIAIFLFGITPGPGVFAILARALVSGSASCFSLALGMAISDIVYLILACYGLAAIAHSWGELFTVIQYLGAAYLFFLGYKIWQAPVDTGVENINHQRSKSSLSFLQGFLISASNPKVILFYIAFLPTFLDVSKLSTSDIMLVSLLTLVGLMLGLMLIAFSASHAKRYFRSEKSMKRLNRSAGAIMAGAGFYLIARDN